MTLIIRSAARSDAPRLSAFAAEAFSDTFGPDNNSSDLARYIAEAFTAERQAEEIDDPNGTILLAESVDRIGVVHLVGYAHLIQGDSPAAVSGAAPIELKRLYVGRPWHGRGVAHTLMEAVLGVARARGAQTLWLGVWERNARAVAFYRKYGFQRVGEHTFMLGSDLQTDWLLARDLGNEGEVHANGPVPTDPARTR